MIDDLVRWLASTHASHFIRIVTWVIPTVQTIYILAISAVVSAVMLIYLRSNSTKFAGAQPAILNTDRYFKRRRVDPGW